MVFGDFGLSLWYMQKYIDYNDKHNPSSRTKITITTTVRTVIGVAYSPLSMLNFAKTEQK